MLGVGCRCYGSVAVVAAAAVAVAGGCGLWMLLFSLLRDRSCFFFNFLRCLFCLQGRRSFVVGQISFFFLMNRCWLTIIV